MKTAVEQLPALALGLGATLWVVNRFLQHIKQISEDHAEALRSIVDQNSDAIHRNLGEVKIMSSKTTEVVTENSRVLGAVQELLRTREAS